ncbi:MULTISPECIES: hypothetical protein [unclassified Mesorhizobium]|uniref:hypothetical protein n=1 Tax=unclassified Mesorhizobium TaxID=325217 RepID=UPI0019CF5647|nr:MULTISPECIES: hypothetical protein [unclassified Mesorhizobium]
MRALEQAPALQAPEQVLGQALVPGLAQALRVPGLAQALPEQASVPRALAQGPASWRPAVQQALALRFFQKHSKRQ